MRHIVKMSLVNYLISKRRLFRTLEILLPYYENSPHNSNNSRKIIQFETISFNVYSMAKENICLL